MVWVDVQNVRKALSKILINADRVTRVARLAVTKILAIFVRQALVNLYQKINHSSATNVRSTRQSWGKFVLCVHRQL